MQFPDLPDIWEEETTTQGKPTEFTAKPTGETIQKNLLEFIIRPSGETIVKGTPTPEFLERVITSSDENRLSQRIRESEAAKRIDDESRMINLMTIGFLGISFLVCILCLFLSTNKQQNQGNSNYAGESIRRTCTY